jgi:hypothetical protein
MKMIDGIEYVKAEDLEQQVNNVKMLLHALGVHTVEEGLRAIHLIKGTTDAEDTSVFVNILEHRVKTEQKRFQEQTLDLRKTIEYLTKSLNILTQPFPGE